MKSRLIIFAVALLGAAIYTKVTRSSRMAATLENESAHDQLNRSLQSQKPLLFSESLPGCPHSAKSDKTIAEVREQFADDYEFFILSGASFTFPPSDPINFVMSNCEHRICLFDPVRREVAGVEAEPMTSEELAAAMQRFADG